MKKTLLLLCTFLCSLGMWAQTTASITQFTAISGDLDENISYASYKGGGTAEPSISSKQLRLYQRASKTSENTIGGYITITAKSGYKISSITWGNGIAGSYTYSTDEVIENGTTSFPHSDASLTSGTPTKISDLNCSTITIYARGTSSSARIYLTSLSVTYDVESSDPRINASDVTIESDATSGEIAYTIKNPVSNVNPTAAITNGDWISNVSVNTSTGKITFDATANTESTERTATITISYTGATSKAVTIKQKKHIVATVYNKVSASGMVIGGTYVWYAQKSDGTGKSVATPLGSNTYFGAGALGNDSSIEENTLTLTTETPELFVFNQVGENTWTIEDADNAGKYLYVSGDKKLAWNTTKNEWTLSGTTQPTFACSTHNSTAYTIFGNLGATRFCAYTALGSMQNAILYHLASESAHTLSCVIDGETTKTYNIKEGYTWKLLTPEKEGYVFQGWATTADGDIVYTDGADYTMAAANATLYAKWRQQTTAPVFTTNLDETYNCIKGGEAVALTVEATDADSYQWYKNAKATTKGATAIDGATEASYSYTGTTMGTEYVYCVATNAVGSTPSTIASVVTAGSNKAVLSHIEFSNGFDAFIKNNTVTAYYMAGTTVPTVNESSIKISDGAEYEIDGNTLTVLAEDGETMVDYTISLSPVTPNTTAATETEFDGTETWIKTGYTFDTTKGWAFAKNVEDNTPRISEGRNRQYWFVGPATEFTLINNGVTSDRNIKVYVNGVEQTGITKIEKASGNNKISITGLSATDNNMVAIVSNNTGGDGGFTKYTFSPAEPATATITFNPACTDGKSYYTTFSCDHVVAVDEAWVNESGTTMAEIKAYAISIDSEGKMTLIDLYDITNDGNYTYIPKNTGVMLKYTLEGEFDGNVTLKYADDCDGYLNEVPSNNLHPSSETMTGDNLFYRLTMHNGNQIGFWWGAAEGAKFDLAANKAYLAVPSSTSLSKSGLWFNNTVTGINAVNTSKKNGVAYNLAGQRVNENMKGIVIINGNKFINK